MLRVRCYMLRVRFVLVYGINTNDVSNPHIHAGAWVLQCNTLTARVNAITYASTSA